MNYKNTTLAFLGLLSLGSEVTAQTDNQIEKNGMKVSWRVSNDSIYFTMSAPTTGWIAIGFNESSSLTGTYLIMGRMRKGSPEVVEHYTLQPGSYRPISELGTTPTTTIISGSQTRLHTRIEFSIPARKVSKHHKNLLGEDYQNMLMAFSRHDDFQHHSVMRTSAKVRIQ